MEKHLLCGKICGMKSRGRQHINYTGSMNLQLYITKKESLSNELNRRADNREEWSAMVADVWNRTGT